MSVCSWTTSSAAARSSAILTNRALLARATYFPPVSFFLLLLLLFCFLFFFLFSFFLPFHFAPSRKARSGMHRAARGMHSMKSRRRAVIVGTDFQRGSFSVVADRRRDLKRTSSGKWQTDRGGAGT